MPIYKNKFARSHTRTTSKTEHDHFEKFKSGWNKLGQKIVLSETMAIFHRNDIDVKERQKQYLHHAKDLFLDIEIVTSTNTKEPLLGKNTFEYCKKMFEELKPKLMSNPQYYEKYVAIVDGVLQDSDDSESELVKRMLKKFSNCEMYIGKITSKLQRGMIESPEQR